ncbi:MAG: hypothetical protein JSV49_03075 [Thermoplasmata archaeon]|nr:MAG: hypothetical protein JSV49_03075 [Thermoplasmata archaeon]
MATGQSRLKRITVPKRIMLLLYDNRKYADSYDVPEVVTQTGIASELNLRQNHVSRALTELLSDELIFSRSSHVKGAIRKRKVYFLTQKGVTIVRDIMDELSLKTILVHTTDGELRELSLERVLKEIKKRQGFSPTYHQLLMKISDEYEIDLNLLESYPDREERRIKKLNIPMSRHFYGRNKELKSIMSTFENNHVRFIIINSIAGQGKTALMIKIVSGINDRPVCWTSLNEWSRLSNLLNDWGYFFKEHKKTALFNYLGTATRLNIQDALKAFITDSRALEPVFIIDDFQKADPKIVKLFKSMKDLLDSHQNIIFMISSRERPAFYGRKDIVIAKQVMELELFGLDKSSAAMILSEKGISETEYDSAYELTKGHPLALELYSPALFSDGQIPSLEIDTYLGEEIIKNLSESESDVVKLASLFQRPVSRSAFFFKPEIDSDVIDSLCNKLILRIYQNGTYDIHDLIKSYFLNRLNDFEKKKYLKIAVDHYSTRGSEKDILEYLRLLRELNDTKRFNSALLENGDFLLSQGYTQVGEYLQDVDTEELSKLDQIRLLILKSDNAFINGNPAKSRSFLEKGLRNCEMMLSEHKNDSYNTEIVQLLSRIYNRSAELSKQEGRLDDTIKAYRESVKLNRKFGNDAEVGKAFNNLALVHRERGELDLALKQLFSAQKVFTGLADQNAIALVEVNIGDIYILKRDFKQANNYLTRVEQTAIKYPEVKGLIFGKLGRTRLQMGEFKSAENLLLESQEAYRKSNDLYNQIKNLNDLFKCSTRLKNKSSSKRYLESASFLLSEHFKDHKSSEIWNNVYNDHLKNGLDYAARWEKESLPDKIEEYNNYHSSYPNAKTILEDLEMFTSNPIYDNKSLLILYSSIEKIFTRLADKHPQVILGIRLAEVLKSLGYDKEAKSTLTKTHGIAKEIGFTKGMNRIEDLLKWM